MKPHKLSEEDVDKLRVMLQSGKTPQDAANYFGLAISSIHNYKRRMKEQNIELPNVHGQRPKGIIKENIVNMFSDEVPNLNKYLHLTIKGIHIYINNTTTSVVINDDTIIIG